uniref:Putative secreted protein n=1 Tax=Anopheles triannulatus TaxID=58253 RepID=A0A2M4B0Y8_9DIPT
MFAGLQLFLRLLGRLRLLVPSLLEFLLAAFQQSLTEALILVGHRNRGQLFAHLRIRLGKVRLRDRFLEHELDAPIQLLIRLYLGRLYLVDQLAKVLRR